MDHTKDNVFEALGITNEEFNKLHNILTGDAGAKTFDDIVKAIDDLDFDKKDISLNLALIRVVQTAYKSAEKSISDRFEEDNPFFHSLYSFLFTLGELTENSEYAESSRTAIILIACMVLSLANLPVSFLVDVMFESLKNIDVNTKDKLRGALALADVMDPHRMIVNPKDVGIH